MSEVMLLRSCDHQCGRNVYTCSCIDVVVSIVFVSRDEHGKAELILLDHGLYDYLNDRDRVSLCQLYKAIILHDDDLMKQYSLQLGVHGKKRIRVPSCL